jgi:hypothetical protein
MCLPVPYACKVLYTILVGLLLLYGKLSLWRKYFRYLSSTCLKIVTFALYIIKNPMKVHVGVKV